ncbi:MAG: bifunctional UDP-N-acetylglucosamine diphosphorylase/glucosamine-1-phosphate N-acetyltransferase GlmU [Geminicoccaceae bacterium]|nr:MAG: bifunctional UDP-N-acetylglucosamine diphosphorylase/glucosamine-1-phosphate N-acetyltransferase GlmU [Geminicoccaceae bacterium]
MTVTFTPVVLAAGQGTRMRSTMAKVLHPLAFEPLLGHVLRAAAAAGAETATLVLAPGMDQVAAFAKHSGLALQIAEQNPPLGTGHALQCAAPTLPLRGAVVVLFGDTPFVEPATIVDLVRALAAADAAVAVLGMELADAGAYGRLLTDGETLHAIVEAADADDAVRALGLANSGVMAFDAARLGELLAELPARTARDGNQEFYLTDTVALARAKGWRCVWRPCSEIEGLGINDRVQLAAAEAILQGRLRERAMRAGVTMLDPASVTLALDTRFGRDVVLEPQVLIGPGVTLEDGVRVRAFSHLMVDGPKETKPIVVRQGAVIGPFARLRSGADVGTDAHVGNFVELKNARLDAGAKANHLTYLGDCSVGAGSNVGAGTITCNYDGFGKYRTEIGAGVFVGSHATLVAPVTIGDGAIIGAGSWVGRDVPVDATHVARGVAEVRPGGAARLRRHLQRRAGKG